MLFTLKKTKFYCFGNKLNFYGVLFRSSEDIYERNKIICTIFLSYV